MASGAGAHHTSFLQFSHLSPERRMIHNRWAFYSSDVADRWAGIEMKHRDDDLEALYTFRGWEMEVSYK